MMTGIGNIDLARAWDDNYGTSALEFAIVAPVFIALVIGTFFLCMGLFVVASMHFAVEEGARCASINQAVCSNATATIAFAKSRYYGPSGAMPTFTYNAAATCGYSISASINYAADLGLTKVTIPFAVTSCFPQ